MKTILLTAFFSAVTFLASGQTTIIAANASWKYKSDGSNQGTTWRTTTFSDAAWSSGAAELGYGDGPATTLTTGKITYYFRNTVSITNPSQYGSFTLKVRRDDGIVVYVNNTEVYRSNMPTGTIAYNTKATAAASDDGSTVYSTTLATSYFVNGTNVIAAEVHNNDASSSDLTFELQLLANPATSCGTPNVTLFETHNKQATSATPYWPKVTGALSYNLQYRVRGVGAAYSSSINTVPDSLTITGLTPATNYEFIVQTVCSGSSSAFSSSGWFTTLSQPTCGVPSGLSTSGVTNNAATLNWTAVTGATGYNIQYRISGASTWTSTTSSTNSKSLSSLSAGTTYEFQVNTTCSAGTGAFSASTYFTTTGAVAGVPQFSHIVIVIGENTSATSVIGSTDAPYINSLANTGANFTQSYGVQHPSQPNYIELFSGGNQGITNNVVSTTHLTAPNLARELINAGKTFVSYADGLPSVGYDGTSSGSYVKKHNPAANWMGTGTNQISSTLIQPFTAFPSNFASLPSVAFITPNLCNDGHDLCSPTNNLVKQYDSWLQTQLDAYKQWCVNNNSLLIITYDEDDGTGTNRIATVFYGAHVQTGSYAQVIDHYAVLRFMEDANGLSTHAGNAASAIPINFCWTGLRVASQSLAADNKIMIYPNPATDHVTVQLGYPEQTHSTIRLFDLPGQEVFKEEVVTDADNREVRLDLAGKNIGSGMYLVQVSNSFTTFSARIVVR